MLQSLRDNLKGGLVATIVILFFVVPLVLTGVGDGSFLGSAAGQDAAEVDGKNISLRELGRAVANRKDQLLSQQGVDPSADYLKDENLRGPVLEDLVRRAALVTSSRKAGAEIADEIIDRQIGQFEIFKADGKFSQRAYSDALASRGFTSSGFRNMLAEDLLVRQNEEAITLSSFNTQKELDILVSLIQQKRSFFTVKIPREKVAEEVTNTDEEIAAYYEENKSEYSEPEKLTANYIQLSVDDLAKNMEVSEEDVKLQYEEEIKLLKDNVEYDIAHILLEGEGKETLIQELQAKLDAGETFEELVAEYSDDSGSKENGGRLGVMLDQFSEEIVSAVKALDEGQVSAPVTSDAGTHFIKVLTKNVEAVPSFEERKVAIADQLKKIEAQQEMIPLMDQLGELSFSAPDLKEVAEAMKLSVKTTPPFTRTSGPGIAGNASFRDAAFANDVLKEGYNSKVVEISAGNVVVLRKAVHTPERYKPLEEVKELISTTLTTKKINEKLDSLAAEAVESLKGGEVEAKAFAEKAGYEFAAFEKAKRSDADADYKVLTKAFSMSLTEGVSYDTVAEVKGGHVIVGLKEVIPGSKTDMPEQQMAALVSQLKMQNGRFESKAFEKQVLANADVEIYE